MGQFGGGNARVHEKLVDDYCVCLQEVLRRGSFGGEGLWLPEEIDLCRSEGGLEEGIQIRHPSGYSGIGEGLYLIGWKKAVALVLLVGYTKKGSGNGVDFVCFEGGNWDSVICRGGHRGLLKVKV
jgi:hypothetical protein